MIDLQTCICSHWSKLLELKMCYLYFFCLRCLINIHIFSIIRKIRLSGLFTPVPPSPDNRGSTVFSHLFATIRHYISDCLPIKPKEEGSTSHWLFSPLKSIFNHIALKEICKQWSFFKVSFSNQKEIYIWSFSASNMLNLFSRISNPGSAEPTTLDTSP